MIDLGSQPNLRSERLWLTPFVDADAPAVFEYAKNPRVSEHTTWTTHQSLADAETFIKMVQTYDTDFCWALRIAPNDPAQGAIEFGLSDAESGTVHFVLAEGLWNQGLITEAVRAVLRWAFDRFESLRTVATGAISSNTGSRRVLEKCGFELTGLVYEQWTKFEEPVQLAGYALTRERWTSQD